MNIWHITDFQLSYVVDQAAGLATIVTLVRLGIIRPYINKSVAFQLYGRKNVLRWIDHGLLEPIKDGRHSSVYRMSRLDLEVISRSLQILRVLNDDQFTT